MQETNKKECSEDKFTCPDGTCLEESYLCDNNDDCTSGADESATCGKLTLIFVEILKLLLVKQITVKCSVKLTTLATIKALP